MKGQSDQITQPLDYLIYILPSESYIIRELWDKFL